MLKIAFEFPYDVRLSKNEWHVYTGRQKGNPWDAFVGEEVKGGSPVANNPIATKLMGDITRMARGACVEGKVVFNPGKVWVHVMVYRPDFMADPVNFIGMIVDGIKRGIGVDDNVYSGSWDWEVDKLKPRIEIRVEQTEHKEETNGKV